MRTQLEVNQYLQDTTIKNAQNLLDIEKYLETEGLLIPNNTIIHRDGIESITFIKWFENKIDAKSKNRLRSYFVSLPFNGCLCVEVQAKNEEDALAIGETIIDAMSNDTIAESAQFGYYEVQQHI